MARSLTVAQEETPTTNPLLTGFLVIAALVLMASAFEAMSPEKAAAPPPPTAVVDR